MSISALALKMIERGNVKVLRGQELLLEGLRMKDDQMVKNGTAMHMQAQGLDLVAMGKNMMER
jgi:hypothetical protein